VGAAGTTGQQPSGAAGTSGAAGVSATSGSGGTAAGGASAAGTGGPAGRGAAGASAPDAAPDTGVVDADGSASEVTGVTDPGTTGDGDFMIGPAYANAPELTVAAGVPRGTVTMFTMKSADSKIFPGINGAYARNVWVYVPSQYKAGTAAPFIVAQDGGDYVTRLPPILDTEIDAHHLPTMIAIMINSGGGNDKGSERGLEYDTVSDKWVTFVETEVLPVVETMFHVSLTSDPNGRATMGGSSGGAAAFTMGWFRPDLYRLVLTYSGTYVNQESPTDPMYPHGAWEYHEHLIPGSPMKPLRVWLECGENDYNSNDPETTYHNFKMANQRMAAALQAKGYHNRFEYALGAQHNDGRVVAQTLSEALLWLWRGYPIP
jgi:iron(III)-enterobactin esterase